MSVEIGDSAPDFELVNQRGEAVRLSGFRGVKPVVLVFYPLSFSGTCTGELCELRDNFAMFESPGIELLAVSVDSKFTQAKFAEQEGYRFQLLADFWPHGEVTREYGAFMDDRGHGNRFTFVIDKDGKVVAKFTTAPGQPRSLQHYESALALV